MLQAKAHRMGHLSPFIQSCQKRLYQKCQPTQSRLKNNLPFLPACRMLSYFFRRRGTHQSRLKNSSTTSSPTAGRLAARRPCPTGTLLPTTGSSTAIISKRSPFNKHLISIRQNPMKNPSNFPQIYHPKRCINALQWCIYAPVAMHMCTDSDAYMHHCSADMHQYNRCNKLLFKNIARSSAYMHQQITTIYIVLYSISIIIYIIVCRIFFATIHFCIIQLCIIPTHHVLPFYPFTLSFFTHNLSPYSLLPSHFPSL